MEQRCGRTDHHLGPGWHQPLENRDESSGDQRPVHDRRTGSRGHVNRARREDGRPVLAEGVARRRTLRAGSGGEFRGRSAGNARIASWHCRQSIRVGNASRGDEGLTGRKANARGAPRSVRSRLPGRGSPGSADVSRGHLAKGDEESLRLRVYARRGIFPDYVGRKNTSHRNIQLRGIRWESSQTALAHERQVAATTPSDANRPLLPRAPIGNFFLRDAATATFPWQISRSGPTLLRDFHPPRSFSLSTVAPLCGRHDAQVRLRS
jgi:hypothetical protein